MPVFTAVPAGSQDEAIALAHRDFTGSYIVTYNGPVLPPQRVFFADYKSVRKALRVRKKSTVLAEFRVIAMVEPAQFFYVTPN